MRFSHLRAKTNCRSLLTCTIPTSISLSNSALSIPSSCLSIDAQTNLQLLTFVLSASTAPSTPLNGSLVLVNSSPSCLPPKSCRRFRPSTPVYRGVSFILSTSRTLDLSLIQPNGHRKDIVGIILHVRFHAHRLCAAASSPCRSFRLLQPIRI